MITMTRISGGALVCPGDTPARRWRDDLTPALTLVTTSWPSSTEAATRPNKEHHNSLEFPFLYSALAIYAENDQNEGWTMFKGREKVPVLVDKGNSHSEGSRRW
jgi:hypothetical protein